jgi:hypothetical protein
MNQLPQNYINEETGISYTLNADGHYIPDLYLPDETEYEIGMYGLMHRDYLKKYRRILYINLLTTGKLNVYLHEIDQTAIDQMELMTKQMREREGVTEQLKAENQLLWIQKASSIHNRVMEIINSELIYN